MFPSIIFTVGEGGGEGDSVPVFVVDIVVLGVSGSSNPVSLRHPRPPSPGG